MDIFLSILSVSLFVLGIYSVITTISNFIHFSNIKRKATLVDDGDLVSVIVPARNEEKNIKTLVSSLKSQDYKNIEFLIINDCSEDRTAEILEEETRGDSRFRIFNGSPDFKKAKNGKINALLQVLPHANGKYFYLTDADTVHEKGAVSYAYSVMIDRNLDIISGYPHEKCGTFFASVIVSAMNFVIFLVPHYIERFINSSFFSVAIGQFIMVKRSSYEKTGGYEMIKDNVCDDMALAHYMVRNRMHYHFVPISRYITCNMYPDSKEAFNGISRSVNGAIPMRTRVYPITFIIVAALLLLSVSPLLAFLYPVYPSLLMYALGMSGWIMFYLCWTVSALSTKTGTAISLCGPVAIFMTAVMYVTGIFRKVFKISFIWKGRKL